MKTKIFVDGEHGTTGLQIRERLRDRADVRVLPIAPEKRKDIVARRELINEADIVFLCLPDEAARESVSLVDESAAVRIIDGSTAHRTEPNWVYGLPELRPDNREAIRNSRRISVPGCHATGFNIIVYPLVQEGLASPDYPFSCYSVTGYSGGGKPLIAKYEANPKNHRPTAPRMYSLELRHKHLPEMQTVPALQRPPVFTPIVGDYYQGEVVSVPLHKSLLKRRMTARELHDFYSAYYSDEQFIRVFPRPATNFLDDGFLDPTTCNGTNRLEIFVFGDADQLLVSARFDNLGKGASGAAIQNMNIVLGLPEESGLGNGTP